MKQIKVFAPASIGNFIVGFDVLGACLHTSDRVLGDELTISDKSPAGYTAVGEFAYKLPEDKENLVIKTAAFFNQKLTVKPQKLTFELSKNLPIGSGLGSSSSSIVATLFGLNEWYQKPFTQQQLLGWSAIIEGSNSGSVHYDNVAPSLLGGLQLICEQLPSPSSSIPFFDSLHFALCFPDIEVTTKSAREILPKSLPLKNAINLQAQLAAFIASCYQNDLPTALALLHDNELTSSRQGLIKNYHRAQKNALEMGAFTFSISGSGPTCFAICDTQAKAEQVSQQMLEDLKQGKHAFACTAQLDKKGARVVGSD